MESFIFNDFKRRIVEGDVPLTDTWTLFPVNKSFTADFDGKLEYVKSANDFSLFFYADHKDEAYNFQKYKTKMAMEDYVYQKLENTDLKSKPFFVTEENFAHFLTIFPGQEHLKDLFFKTHTENGITTFYNFAREDHREKEVINGVIQDKIVLRGFYYVNTAEELKWCAEKVNGTIYDNKINIVLGDNIGVNKEDFTIDSLTQYSTDSNDFKIINFSVGSNPAQPFEGVFYGNGFKFVNLILDCENDVNGIFGYVGPEGIISTVRISGVNILRCKKSISLTHLTTNGTNIYAGILCGKNNGAIENVTLEGNVIFSKFAPKMYHSKIKTDNKDQVQSTSCFEYYPNYYCYDNPGNIVPYIGYFNEGVFATFSGYNADGNIQLYWNTESPVSYEGEITQDDDSIPSPMEWYYFDTRPNITDGNRSYFYMYNTYTKNRINILWYDGTIINKAAEMAGNKAGQICANGLFLISPNDLKDSVPLPSMIGRERYGLDPQAYGRLKYAQYFDESIKLSQQNRLAYYVSPLIGNNNSIVNNTCVTCSAYTSGTFVGFMGGIAGMQNYGELTNICSCISAYDIEETSNDLKQKTYYKRDWEYQLIGNAEYIFPKKSIKNIGGLFGSCVIQGSYGAPGLQITNVVAHLNNKNNIIFSEGDINTPMYYDDYFFDNRFGTIAAMVELNSSNISDFWQRFDDLRDYQNRCIKITNGTFGYAEPASENEVHQGDGLIRCTPYKVWMGGQSVNNADNAMYGAASPLFAELKPTYLSTPSIISTLFENVGTQLSDNKVYSRTGIFGVDQNFAAPFSNPNFWSINIELDMPGVGGCGFDDTYAYFANSNGIPNSLVDRLNNPEYENFSLTLSKMASKLVCWNNCYVNNNYNQGQAPFVSVRYPKNAEIQEAYCATAINETSMAAVGTVYPRSSIGDVNATAVDPKGNVLSYAANKIIYKYPYFGSDLKLIKNYDPSKLKSQLATGWKQISFTADNPFFRQGEKGVHVGDGINTAHYIANNVKYVYMTIQEEAMKYKPFTDVPIPGNTRAEQIANINKWYKVSVEQSEENGCNANDGHESGVQNGEFVDIADKFSTNGKFNSYAFVNGVSINYGFLFYIDYSNNDHYGYFFIPFDVFTDNHSVEILPWPPYSTFEGYYIRAYDWDDSHEGHNVFEGKYYNMYGARNYLGIIKSEITPITEFFTGYTDETRQEETWTQLAPAPSTSRKMVVAKYRINPATNAYEFINAYDTTQTTLDYTSAATGYFIDQFDDVTAASDTSKDIAYKRAHFFMDSNRIITDLNGKRHQCYGPADGEILYFYDTTDPQSVLYSSAANVDMVIVDDVNKGMSEISPNLANVTYDEQNWESPFERLAASDYGTVHFITEWPVTAAYSYSYSAVNYVLPLTRNNGMDSINYPEPWHVLGIKGKFYNNLGWSENIADSNLAATVENLTGYDPNGFSAWLYNRTEAIKNNVNEANKYVSTQDDQLLNYYKYTYEKSAPYTYTGCIEGIPLDVKFNYANNKAGFWFKMPNTSGHIEYNDKIHYGSNVFNIGKTLNQDSILNDCFVSAQKTYNKYEWKTSGFSADDFEGIYVRDSHERPVMYIDVGLGECTNGTSWTLSAYPSINYENSTNKELINQVSGLILEIE